MIKKLLLIPHIQVQNANALSSPYTIGFPAMTAWLGATHALQRKLNQQGFSDLIFLSTAVISHKTNLQTYRGQGDYVHSIVGTANPLDRHGGRPAFVEQARCHLDVSLLVEYRGVDKEDEEGFRKKLDEIMLGNMKIAGGDILKCRPSELLRINDNDEEQLRKLTRRLMPGYVLVERRHLMQRAMEEGQDAIEALLDHLKIMHRSEQHKDGSTNWHSHRKEKGWIVPIATGFQALTALGQARNQRDPETPHRFAESIVTLGEFIMPYRVESLDEMLWHYHVNPQQALYVCQQNTERQP